MKKLALLFLVLFLFNQNVIGQTTSWKGTTSTSWNVASNWTAGVPVATVDAIIGDASFTGSFQPIVNANAACKSLTIGNSIKVSSLSVNKNITVSGAILIGTNGTITHGTNNTVITLKGNWTNLGVYNATVASAQVTFSGTGQTLNGSTTFKKVLINTGSILTLAANITINTDLSVNGAVDPTASYKISGTGTLNVFSGGIIYIKAANFSDNFALSGLVVLSGRSTVNYASAIVDQNVSSTFTYGYLRISGGMTKSLSANLPALSSASGNSGRIYIDAGNFDLKTFTANRNTNGGSFIIAGGAKLKIGGTNGFPSNYSTITIASNSTVEYYGTNQTILATTYGNLTFSSSAGSVVKTMPATAITIAGNFTSLAGSGTAVSFTAAQNITVSRDVSLDAATTFDGGTRTHLFKGNWTNNGIFTGSTSTVAFSGVSAVVSGAGTNNFYNLSFSGSGITAPATTTLNIAGNLSTSGSGTFTHAAGGIVNVSGTSKTFSGNGLKLHDCNITGSITTTSNLQISGNFLVNGSFAASAGTLTLNGAAKTISGSGTFTFFALTVLGTITTANSFSILSNLVVAVGASFAETAGTTTFNGTTVLSGEAYLYNVTISNTRTLGLGTNALLGITNVFTKTGTLNVTTSAPNTVQYNGAGAQTIVSTTYSNLILTNGGTKPAGGAITVNNDFTINTGVTFDAATFTFTVNRHFTNGGTFTPSTSTVQLAGANASTITGATTFYNLIENKTNAAVIVTLANSISTSTLTLTSGNMETGTNAVTITGTRGGNGLITGTIIHNHTFANGTAYSFEGPKNTITFTSPSASLNSVTVVVTIGEVTDFNPAVECIMRQYEVSIPAGTFTNATWSMHYLDNELNAFDEPNLSQYKYNSGTAWDSIGFTTRNTATNFVQRTGITSLAGRWTLSGIRNLVRWNGSVSTAWETAANWTTISGSNMANRIPSSTDAAQIGFGAFTNQPLLTTAQTVNVLRYGSVQSSTLSIGNGSLTTIGSIQGVWSANATHVLDVSSYTLNIGTNLILCDGTNGHDINLKIGNGLASVANDITQNGTGAITFTGTGTLSTNGNFNYTAGTFSAGSGTVVYTGVESQLVGPVIYNNLSFTKTTDRAKINFKATVNGNLTTSVGGEVAIYDTLNVGGNITIGASTNFIEMDTRINIGGSFTTNGLFTINHGTVNFNGTINQNVNANTFNTILVNKPSGVLTAIGNLVINSDFIVNSGTFDLSTFGADRSNPGGNFVLGPGTTFKVGGANNFPYDYVNTSIDVASTVDYNGVATQSVVAVNYGNLVFNNGSSNPKSLLGNIQVNGNFAINSGSTFDPDSNSVTLYGNYTNNGTFMPAGSTLILNGISKTFTGASTLYNLYIINGSYTVTTGAVSMAGDLFIDVNGTFSFGNNSASLDGDLTNKGSLTSNGSSTFTGTRIQTLQLIKAITSSSTGIINFNGTIPPVLSSNTPPSFATVNINNTGGVTPSLPWTVYFNFTVGAGASFDGGFLYHTFYGNFTNNGTVLSSGELEFAPGAPYSGSGTIKLDGQSFISTGRIEFDGTAPITIIATNPSINEIDVANTNAAGVTLPTSLTINADLYIDPNSIVHGGNATTITILGNLTNNGTLDGSTSTFSFGGNPVSMNGVGTTSYNHLTIASGSDVTLNQSIKISGDLIVDGNLTTLGRAVSFIGTNPANISGAAGSVTFDDFEQNKPSASTTLAIPVTLVGDLTMTDGIIFSDATNILSLTDGATSTAGNTSCYVDGPMKKIGNDAFVFPVGNAGIWARLGISAPSLTSDAFTATYFANPYSDVTTLAASPTPVLTNVSGVEYWTCDRTVGTSSVSVQLFWEDAVRSDISNYTDIVVAHWNGSGWENQGQAFLTSTDPGSVTSVVQNSFSPFTLGSVNGGNTLPISLLNFSAKLNSNKKVDINWTTVTEVNNHYFTIERSKDALNFEEISRVEGQINSVVKKYYAVVDENPLVGTSYYRLKQTDYNGAYTYSGIRSIEIANDEDIDVFPNPNNGESFKFSMKQNVNEEVLVVLCNSLGQEVFSKVIINDSQAVLIALDVQQRLAPGIYSVIATSKNGIYKRKLIIK